LYEVYEAVVANVHANRVCVSTNSMYRLIVSLHDFNAHYGLALNFICGGRI